MNKSRIFLYLVAATVAYLLVLSGASSLAQALHRKEPLFSLWVGRDFVDGKAQLRSLQLVRYDPKVNGVQVLSLPPHTKVEFPLGKNSSLAEVYKKNRERDFLNGARALSQSVQELLSMAELSIPYYIQFDEKFISILEKETQPWNFVQSLYRAFSAGVSNLNFFEKALFVLELKNLEGVKVHRMELPGRSQGNFWVPDEGAQQTARLMLTGNLKNVEKNTPSLKTQLTLEVWNATGKKGVALEVTRRLRLAGFDVVKWGNHQQMELHTVVHDLKGNVQETQEIAKLVSPEAQVYTKIEDRTLVDVIVIVGQDYRGEE